MLVYNYCNFFNEYLIHLIFETLSKGASGFDIFWYAFGRLVADVAPPADYGIDDDFSQASILSCLACGSYFLRRSSRQRYCQNWDCQAERNLRNRRASYARHKNDLEIE